MNIKWILQYKNMYAIPTSSLYNNVCYPLRIIYLTKGIDLIEFMFIIIEN